MTASPALALDPSRTISQFQHTAWTIKDGAPPDVWTLAQSRDGYIWLGTGGGLYRFDGIRFERVQLDNGGSFPNIDITALTATPNGDLWIGYLNGGVSVLHQGRLRNFLHEIPPGPVSRIAALADGTLWIGTFGGLVRYAGGTWETIDDGWGLPRTGIGSLLQTHAGTLVIATEEAVLYLRPGSHRFEATGERVDGWYSHLAEASDGRVWLTDRSGGTRALPEFSQGLPKRSPPAARTRPEGSPESKRLMFDADGALWGTDAAGGIYRAPFPNSIDRIAPQANRDMFKLKDGLSSDIAVPILEDREHNIWVGTNLGVDRFRAAAVVPQADLKVTSSYGYVAAQGRDAFYVAAGEDIIAIRPDHAPETIGHVQAPLKSMCTAPDGSVRLTTGSKLWRLDGRRLQPIAAPSAIDNQKIWNCTFDSKGQMWISVEHQGVFEQTPVGWRRLPFGFGERSPTQIEGDHSGGVWLYYDSGRLKRVQGDQVRDEWTVDAVGIGPIQSLAEMPSGLLAGGDLGVAEFDGRRFRVLTSKRIPVLTRVSGAIKRPDGEVWAAGIQGVVHLFAGEFDHALQDPNYRPRYEVLDYHDGLPGAAQQDSDGSTVIAGSQGRVWFITNHGLAWMDPAHPVHNDLAPPVLILAALENGRRFDVTPGLKLPAGATHLEIDYTAPSLTMPERVRFRYRLEGVDENWIDPGLRRQAYYTNLKPGKYRFQVIAANNDGVWNNTGAAWTFEIPPTFVQSKWFIALCAVSVLGVMWFAYAVRLRYMAERIQGRLQERVTERERIARELHDTLLQGFQGVVLRFQSVADQLSDAQAKRRMEDVLERADEVLLEGRDRVMDLRSLDASSDLSETLIAAGQDVIINPAISFQVRTTGTTRAIHPVVFEETIKIGREAISNAAQHGHPSDIEASIDYRRRHLSLRVRDNGGGIEPAILRRGAREGHFGLPGMRERARKIRADFHLTSRTGLGTEVRVVVPAGVAYAAASPRKAPSPLRFAFLGRR